LLEYLLDPPADAPPEDFDSVLWETFKAAHGNAKYSCRYQECAQSTSSFSSVSEREQHETAHMRKFKCKVAYCLYEIIGFTRQRDLSQHYTKYHPKAAEADIPAFPGPRNRRRRSLSAPRTPRTPLLPGDEENVRDLNADGEQEDEDEEANGEEAIYCYCRGISYGEMVACDAENCPREWFHLECVGLEKAPGKNSKCGNCIYFLFTAQY
jgi:hypothetical protein